MLRPIDLNKIFNSYAASRMGVIGFARSGLPFWAVPIARIGDTDVAGFAVREEYMFALDSAELVREILAEFEELEPLNYSFECDATRAQTAADFAAGSGMPYVVTFNHDLDFVIFVGSDP